MSTLSRRHPLCQRLRRLRREASLRRDEAVLVAEGPHLVDEALRSNATIELVITSPRLAQLQDGPPLLERLQRRGLPLHTTEASILDGLQDARSPQPIVAVVRRPRERPPQLTGAPRVVVAHNIQDPGNLGGILRSAEAAGAGAVWVTGSSADPFHPRAVRATMGSIFRLPLRICDWNEAISDCAAAGLERLGTVARGGEALYDAPLPAASALILGSEAHGLSQEELGALDRCIAIPMEPSVESLSVGAAAAAVLFEYRRRRSAD